MFSSVGDSTSQSGVESGVDSGWGQAGSGVDSGRGQAGSGVDGGRGQAWGVEWTAVGVRCGEVDSSELWRADRPCSPSVRCRG